MTLRPLRPRQSRALDLLRASLMDGHRCPMIQAPCGFGKTLTAAHMIDGARRKGKRVTFTVPSVELIDKTVEDFWAEGIRDIGVIQADHPMTNYAMPVQIASVQTLSRRHLPTTDLVIADEAHRAYKIIFDWMGKANIPFVGLSATPWTKGLGKYYDDLIIAATSRELIDEGLLSPYRYYEPGHPDFSGVRTVAGDYHEGDLSEVMNKPHVVADVVQTWLALGENRPTLCFAVDKAHARSLLEKFEAAGVPTAYVDDQTPRNERTKIRLQFAHGAVKVVVNVGVLSTGVDWDVRCISWARRTKSEIFLVQGMGRGFRTRDGKDDCIILDHTDTRKRLGYPDEIHHETLDDGESREVTKRSPRTLEELPTECGVCGAHKPTNVRKCPSCGFEAQRQSNVATLAGELVQSNGNGKSAKPQPAEKRAFYAQLKGYAVTHGKSDKWVLANFREKFSEWPDAKNVAPQQPSQAVLNWVKSRQIAWAKSKAKEVSHAA